MFLKIQPENLSEFFNLSLTYDFKLSISAGIFKKFKCTFYWLQTELNNPNGWPWH